MYREVPFGKEEEWADIEPVEQYEGGRAPICAIPYSEQYVTILSYFRAILKKEEVSYRAYKLTEKVIEVSGGNYMAWFWRRKCVDELDIKAEEEFRFIREKCIQYQKNYQIWHHRRCISEKYQFHQGERESLEEVFLENPKNFHAWTYRQWLTERFELYEGEDEFVAECLEDDVHNNSVWAYKYFLLAKSQELTPELVSNQIEQVFIKYLPKDWNNEAAWAFLRGFTAVSQEEEDESKNSSVRRFLITKFQHFRPLLDKFFENEQNQENRFALELLADFSIAEGNLDKAKQSYQKLAQVDFIREKFWNWKLQRLEQKP